MLLLKIPGRVGEAGVLKAVLEAVDLVVRWAAVVGGEFVAAAVVPVVGAGPIFAVSQPSSALLLLHRSAALEAAVAEALQMQAVGGFFAWAIFALAVLEVVTLVLMVWMKAPDSHLYPVILMALGSEPGRWVFAAVAQKVHDQSLARVKFPVAYLAEVALG